MSAPAKAEAKMSPEELKKQLEAKAAQPHKKVLTHPIYLSLSIHPSILYIIYLTM
jgi:hypothetical protein